MGFGWVWGGLGKVLRGSWGRGRGFRGWSWGDLGQSWGVLGWSWGLLGIHLGALWWVCGGPGAAFGDIPTCTKIHWFSMVFEGFGVSQQGLWRVSRVVWGAVRGSVAMMGGSCGVWVGLEWSWEGLGGGLWKISGALGPLVGGGRGRHPWSAKRAWRLWGDKGEFLYTILNKFLKITFESFM